MPDPTESYLDPLSQLLDKSTKSPIFPPHMAVFRKVYNYSSFATPFYIANYSFYSV
jgi:hypothetical protein